MTAHYTLHSTTMPSRSGGPDHEIQFAENVSNPHDRINWLCSCKAAHNGKECWAIRAIRKELERLDEYGKLGRAS